MTPSVTRWIGICFLLAGMLITLWQCEDANAHSWYDLYCCNEKDCKELKHDEVTEDGDSYIVIIDGKVVYEIPKDSKIIRPSQDANYHICTSPYNLAQPRCFYVPVSA